MPSFSIPLTGLEADSAALNTIANNLANMNTIAFKSQTATFSDLFYQQIGVAGSGDPIEIGAGTQVASTATNFTTGSINSTSVATNMAIDGNGFFVVEKGLTPEYTRDGDFTLASDGTLTTQDGLNVMGYPAVNGSISTSAPLSPIRIPVGGVEPAQATSQFSMTANLDASAAAGTMVPVQMTVYDSLGEKHTLTVTFTKASTPNSWSYDITLPSGDAATTANTTGTVTFDPTGKLLTPTANVTGIGFNGLTDGANDLSFAWALYNSSNQPTISQSATGSGSSATSQNGYASGKYRDFAVDANGVISVTYDNEQTVDVGQLAIASVTNEQGLIRLGNNNYQTTSASGQASIGAANSGGRGRITGESLEGSNVDISREFSNLIVAQRAFEANSKSITTFDAVTQEAINMIH
jgi:flagellar hook protein FlgE